MCDWVVCGCLLRLGADWVGWVLKFQGQLGCLRAPCFSEAYVVWRMGLQSEVYFSNFNADCQQRETNWALSLPYVAGTFVWTGTLPSVIQLHTSPKLQCLDLIAPHATRTPCLMPCVFTFR
jgi:hypothetical protein